METAAEAGGGGGGGGGGGSGGGGACGAAGGGAGAGVPLGLSIGKGDDGEGDTDALGFCACLCGVVAVPQAAPAKTSNMQHQALHPLTAEQVTSFAASTALGPARPAVERRKPSTAQDRPRAALAYRAP